MAKFDRALLPPYPDFHLENKLWAAGIRSIAGIDEAGRGALAGPVAAAALIFPPKPDLVESLHGLQDSKALSPSQRVHWVERIILHAQTWHVGFASSEEIDRLGIIPATRLASSRALKGLAIKPEHLLLDYLLLPNNPTPQTSLTKGDARSLSIAAASILAKVSRDEKMCTWSHSYPDYGFSNHKGYGTAMHRGALQQWGPTPIHRLSFAPLKKVDH